MTRMDALKYKFEAGALVRRAVLARVVAIVLDADCEVDYMHEDRGWLASTYRMRITGPQGLLEGAKADLDHFFSLLSR